MERLGLPYDRGTYLSLEYGPDIPDPLSGEEEAELPPEFQLANQEQQPGPSGPSPVPAQLKRVMKK